MVSPFLPELLGNQTQQKRHSFLYFEYPEKGGQVAIRMGDWKGVKTDVRKDPWARRQLFNLKTDRNKTTDVVAKHNELVEQFDAIQMRDISMSMSRNGSSFDPKSLRQNRTGFPDYSNPDLSYRVTKSSGIVLPLHLCQKI